MTWKIKLKNKPKAYPNAVLIVGLPGIANVGKIAADYLVAELETKLFAEIISDQGPAFTIIDENNLVIMPRIDLYHKKVKRVNFFFLIGDYQPTDDNESYSFCTELLKLADKLKIKQILTLGGIGLEEEPQKPKIFMATNNKKFADNLKKYKIKTDISLRVGTILGITGLAVARSKMSAAALLSETSVYPGFIGLNAAKVLIQKLKQIFSFDIKLNNLNKEIKAIEKIAEALIMQQEKISSKKMITDVNYIG
jgi:proteasome assembly chaperone (PAC2) family protein